jgi:hypothetical protein
LRIPTLRKLKLKTCLQVNISLYLEMLFYKLLETCLECGLVIKKLNSYTKRSMLCVKIVCECGNKITWYSQPMVGKRPEGNVLIASSLLLSGILFTPFKSFCNTIKMPMMPRSTFDKRVNNIVGPVIKDKDLWYVEREKNLNTLKNSREPIWLAGDGQFDSPGFSAKYIICSTMDLHSGLIIDSELLQKDLIKANSKKQLAKNYSTS